MDWLDYREKLGIGFSDEEKGKLFIGKVQNFIYSASRCPFEEQDEMNFCNEIGCASLCNSDSVFNMLDLDTPVGLKRSWLYLEKHTDDALDFLAHMIALINTYGGKKGDRDIILNTVKRALDESHISYDIFQEGKKYFIFPKGAKELDDALVSEPLEWLKDYPNAQKTYIIALKQYSEGIYIRDVADNLRKALEAFLQEFLGNSKNLETNKNEICKYLGEQGVDAGVSGLFQPLINAYKNINDRIAKHNDAVDKKLLEFVLYQTDVLIRMVLSVKQEEK